MCGFCGFVDASIIDKQPVIKEMADQIIHRGPDSEGFFTSPEIALGFRRLSIIDLEHGHQPITTEDERYTICFNGEIYNYQLIRKDLEAEGVSFKTNSDTEVILRGFVHWGGVEILHRLRGMFAFVIWDNIEKTLFGARDPFGIKPFYYQQTEDRLIFGSEIKSFLPNPNFRKEVNIKVLPDYLSFEYIPSAETLFKDVNKLLGGEYFTFKSGNLKIDKYYQVEFDPDQDASLEDWTNRIQSVIEDSVQAHQIADVEIGCFLSSGIDSSYITKEVTKSHQHVKAFSVGYAEQQYSELSYARDFAEKLDAEFHEREIGSDESFNAVPQMQYLMDEPLPNPSAIPLFFLTEEASKYVKVVVSGEGADELFGGYNQYREPLDYAKYQKVPAVVRKAIGKVASVLPKVPGKRFLMRNALPLSERFFRNYYVYSFSERMEVLSPAIRDKVDNRPAHVKTAKLFSQVKHLDEITQMMYLDIHTWMLYDILQKADKMSMAHSLELRVPFLDKEVFEIARHIPARFQVDKENTKIALRKTAIKQIPERTANKKKLGFPVPLNDWLRQEPYLSQVRERFESEEAARFFNQDHLRKMLDIHVSGVNGYMKRIWSIYCFLVWYDEFFVKR